MPVKALTFGNWLMAVCGGFYLAWWLVAFRPPKPRNTPLCTCLLALAFLFGLAGTYLCGRALSAPLVQSLPGIRNQWITTAGIAAYVILLALTALAFRRPVTSELAIITAWTVLELCVINTLYRYGNLLTGTSVSLTVLILAAAIVSLACYVLYYRLPYTSGYVAGCVPLVLAVAGIIAVNLSSMRII